MHASVVKKPAEFEYRRRGTDMALEELELLNSD